MKSSSLIGEWKMNKSDDKILNKELELPVEKLEGFFDTKILFGEEGMFGTMGAGTSKVNIHTVSLAAQAFSELIMNNENYRKGIVISCDNRPNSEFFLKSISDVLSNNGIKVFSLKKNLSQPFPLISYAVRNGDFSGGILISGMNRPQNDNGIIFLDQNGMPIGTPDIKKINSIMLKMNPLAIKRCVSNILSVDDGTLIKYTKKVSELTKKQASENICVSFTAMNESSLEIGTKILKNMGHNVHSEMVIENSKLKIGTGKTFGPENGKTYKNVERLARKTKSDLLFSLDSTGNKVGAAVKYQKRYKFLSGNQMATLYLEYMLTTMKREGILPENGYIVTSTTSSNLPIRVAEKFGVKVIKTHLGFNNVVKEINPCNGTFLFAFEESFRFLISPDLGMMGDAFQAMAGISEMVAYYKSRNINTYSHLKDIYSRYGIHRTLKTSKNIDKKQQNKLMKSFLNSKRIGAHKIVAKTDFGNLPGKLDTQKTVEIEFESGS